MKNKKYDNFVFYSSWLETLKGFADEFSEEYAKDALWCLTNCAITGEMTTNKKSIQGWVTGSCLPNIQAAQERYKKSVGDGGQDGRPRDEERDAEIIALSKQGISKKNIAQKCNCSSKTVTRVLQHYGVDITGCDDKNMDKSDTEDITPSSNNIDNPNFSDKGHNLDIDKEIDIEIDNDSDIETEIDIKNAASPSREEKNTYDNTSCLTAQNTRDNNNQSVSLSIQSLFVSLFSQFNGLKKQYYKDKQEKIINEVIPKLFGRKLNQDETACLLTNLITMRKDSNSTVYKNPEYNVIGFTYAFYNRLTKEIKPTYAPEQLYTIVIDKETFAQPNLFVKYAERQNNNTLLFTDSNSEKETETDRLTTQFEATYDYDDDITQEAYYDNNSCFMAQKETREVMYNGNRYIDFQNNGNYYMDGNFDNPVIRWNNEKDNWEEIDIKVGMPF